MNFYGLPPSCPPHYKSCILHRYLINHTSLTLSSNIFCSFSVIYTYNYILIALVQFVSSPISSEFIQPMVLRILWAIKYQWGPASDSLPPPSLSLLLSLSSLSCISAPISAQYMYNVAVTSKRLVHVHVYHRSSKGRFLPPNWEGGRSSQHQPTQLEHPTNAQPVEITHLTHQPSSVFPTAASIHN